MDLISYEYQSNMTTPTSAKHSSKTTAALEKASVAASKRDQRLEDISSHREQLIQQRQQDAAESKARTLKMYDNMAKSGVAGDHRALDINTYRGKDSGKLLVSGSAIQKKDLVEETIRERVRASEENKKRLLAAYDYAAKTQPAGTVRDVDFESFKGVDVSGFEADKPQGAATFQMSNGVPNVVKASSSVPSTPVIDIKKAPSFTQEQPQLDAYERALRQRKQEVSSSARVLLLMKLLESKLHHSICDRLMKERDAHWLHMMLSPGLVWLARK